MGTREKKKGKDLTGSRISKVARSGRKQAKFTQRGVQFFNRKGAKGGGGPGIKGMGSRKFEPTPLSPNNS